MIRFIAAGLAVLLVPAALRADEASTVQEIRELKELVNQQMKRLDELTVQIGRLHQSVEAQRAGSAPGPEPKHDVVGPPPFSGTTELKGEPEAKVDAAPAEPPKASAAVVPPRAEAVGGTRHVVAKGETLTSIAKHYNIALADMQKANKEVNDRKLQIGQTLVVPVTKTPETKPAEPAPAEKKDPL